jgi:hypothetical protein
MTPAERRRAMVLSVVVWFGFARTNELQVDQVHAEWAPRQRGEAYVGIDQLLCNLCGIDG